MKCPKCGYLGFEQLDRCRNCGYDFSLAPSGPNPSGTVPDLTLKADTALHPLDDLSLLDRAMPAAEPAARPAVPLRSSELLLFGSPLADDVALISKASPPRQPLAVRRATPNVSRVRVTPPREQTLNLLPDGPEKPRASAEPRFAATPGGGESVGPEAGAPPYGEDMASVGARSMAAAIDLLILAAIDAAVVYFTMQICGIGLGDVRVLPRGPLVAFLLAQNGGYLVAFTAGGQTLGKMAAGIKVVPEPPGSSLDIGRAALRELVWVLLAAPAGLGLLATLFTRDRRGLHDRFAGTRVVRVSL